MNLTGDSEAGMDAELVFKFKGGKESAFEDLVRRHMKQAYSFCLRLTGREEEAEEVSQEGFVHAYRSLGNFRGDSTFRSWLFRILINLYRDRLRRRRREETRWMAVRETAMRRRSGGEEESRIYANELADTVKGKIQCLPERQREVLVLHVYQGLSHREISGILACSYEDVKVNLSLARKRLKEELSEYL